MAFCRHRFSSLPIAEPGARHSVETAVWRHSPHGFTDHIQSFAIIVDQPIPDTMLDAWLDLLLAMCGQDMLRIKGILHVRGRTNPIAIHGVQHLFYPPIELPGWTSEDRRSKLVFITRDVPRAVIEETLEAFLATWPDESSIATDLGAVG
jgi:G3E family GTPase